MTFVANLLASVRQVVQNVKAQKEPAHVDRRIEVMATSMQTYGLWKKTSERDLFGSLAVLLLISTIKVGAQGGRRNSGADQ